MPTSVDERGVFDENLGCLDVSTSNLVLRSVEIEDAPSSSVQCLMSRQINTQQNPALQAIHYPSKSYNPHVYVQPSLNQLPEHHRGHPKPTEDNVPSRFELFLLNDGEKKVVETADTRIPSSSLFLFNKEDHTLGNLLRSRLLQSPHVTFAGYKVPHPLFSNFELRVQTDGEVAPRAALVQACRDLVNDLGTLSREFTKEWELRKMVGEGVNGVGGDK